MDWTVVRADSNRGLKKSTTCWRAMSNSRPAPGTLPVRSSSRWPFIRTKSLSKLRCSSSSLTSALNRLALPWKSASIFCCTLDATSAIGSRSSMRRTDASSATAVSMRSERSAASKESRLACSTFLPESMAALDRSATLTDMACCSSRMDSRQPHARLASSHSPRSSRALISSRMAPARAFSRAFTRCLHETSPATTASSELNSIPCSPPGDERAGAGFGLGGVEGLAPSPPGCQRASPWSLACFLSPPPLPRLPCGLTWGPRANVSGALWVVD
mmetsp:Transcript_60863/g.162849  ORF Transcript_60863/g.162849 Transcript_60863/m.162849 type:complete len:274 (-) Transcript_60863:861-1682(-)